MLEEQFIKVVEKNNLVFLDEEEDDIVFGIDTENYTIDVTYIKNEKIATVYELNTKTDKVRNKTYKTISGLEKYLENILFEDE